MRIRKLFIPSEESKSLGIEQTELKRLGPVVALVGRNGSGKSRILKLIETKFFPNIDVTSFLNGDIEHPPLSVAPVLPQFVSLAQTSLRVMSFSC